MRIVVSNHQRRLGIRTAAVRRLLAFLMKAATYRRKEEWAEVHLLLTDNPGIREINRRHLRHDYPTDVISFEYAPVPGEPGPFPSGEIVVNVERAMEVGPAHGGLAHEIALYLAHGCDHLTGGRDGSPRQRQLMRRRELAWLRRAKRLDLLSILSPTSRHRSRR